MSNFVRARLSIFVDHELSLFVARHLSKFVGTRLSSFVVQHLSIFVGDCLSFSFVRSCWPRFSLIYPCAPAQRLHRKFLPRSINAGGVIDIFFPVYFEGKEAEKQIIDARDRFYSID